MKPTGIVCRTVFALLISAATLHGSAQAAARPNVIVVLTDDQGYGDFSCHGNPVLKTPNLDKLHAESIRFTDFHVTPMCTPTRGQLLTGRDALANGAYCVCSGRTFIHREIATLPEIFAANGYKTAMFGKWHLGDNYPHRPMDRGFQEAVYHLGWGITSTPDYWNNDYFDDYFRHNGRIQQYPGYCTDVFFAEAKHWIRTRATRGEPFLAYLPLNAPHGPFFVPPKYRELYRGQDRDVAGFFGMLANIDDNFAALDAMLRETGLRDNTLLLFITDNGGTGGISVYNAGLRGAKTSLYDGGHRAACFLRWPAGKLRLAGDIASLTQCQDILPTLVELCGLQQPPDTRFDGLSLAPVLRGREQPELSERMLVVQYGGLVRSEPSEWDSAVLWNRWRLVSGKELYDVRSDPGQQHDVGSRHPAIVARMRDHYQRWWAAVQPSLAAVDVIHVGSRHENPVRLSAMDWYVPKLTPCAQPFDIRLVGTTTVKEGSLPLGRPQPVLNGPWNIHVDRAGQYEIRLRRWPQEADATLTAGLPSYQGVDGAFPAGIPLPIAKARLKIASFDQTTTVAEGAKAVTFDVRLAVGKTQLQTWFYDRQGKELCGAFYVEVLRQ